MFLVRLGVEIAIMVIVGGVAWFTVGRPAWAYIRQLPSIRAWREERELQYRQRRVRLLRQEIGVRREELTLLEAESQVEREEDRALGLDQPSRRP